MSSKLVGTLGADIQMMRHQMRLVGYAGQTSRDVREVLARVKDFGMTIFWPEPTYLGEAIPISGSGDLTHDENSDFS